MNYFVSLETDILVENQRWRNWGKLCTWNNYLEIFCFLFRISFLFFTSYSFYISFVHDFFRYARAVPCVQVAHAPASEIGRPSSAFVCSRLRDSRVRWIEKARTWKKTKTNKQTKKIGRKLGRGRALPFSFFLPRQLFACLSLWRLPRLLHVFPTICTIWEPGTC